jgi:hypothetical protein
MSVKGKIALLEHIDKPSYKYVFQSKQCDIVKKFQQIKRDVCRVVIPKPLQKLSEAYNEDKDWCKWNFRILEDVEEPECSDKIQQMKRLSSKLKEKCYYHCLRDGKLNGGSVSDSRSETERKEATSLNVPSVRNTISLKKATSLNNSVELSGCWK